MKYLFLILISALIAGTYNSCSKNPVENKTLIGEWQHIYSWGGWALDTIRPAPDSIETLKFNKDFTYATYTNNQIRGQGTYYFTMDHNYTIIHFKFDNAVGSYNEFDKEIIEISSSKLHLNDYDIFEGFDDYYNKIK